MHCYTSLTNNFSNASVMLTETITFASMGTKKILLDLKRSFFRYITFYEEWSKYKHNQLSELDLYILKIHLKNDFEVACDDLVMFYNQPGEIAKLVQKLDENYALFQEWLILKFQIGILELARETPLELFFETPFGVTGEYSFSIHGISDDLLQILKKFGYRNFAALFQNNSEKDFMKEEKFEVVVEFMSVLKIETTIYKSLKKEVKFVNENCSFN